jgi:hypothetical protein
MGEWFSKHVATEFPTRSPRVFPIIGVEVFKGEEYEALKCDGFDYNEVMAEFGGETDVLAYEVAKRAAPEMPEQHRQYVLTVARGEGYYGRGWKQGQGAGSHNWGAVQGSGSAGSFPHIDYHADGTSYTGYFKAYQTDEEGFLDMARILLKQNVKQALDRGSLKKAVYAQHDNRYFELAPEKYLDAVTRNYKTITDSVGWPKKLSLNGRSLWIDFGAIAAGIAAGIYGVRRLAK